MNRLSARGAFLGSVLVAGLLLAWGGIRMARAAASELADFHPTRRAIPLPTDADALALRPVTFAVPGSGPIHGWYAPTHNGAAVILLHGSGSDRRQVLGVARALVQGGYGTLLFDWPGHGESDGVVRYGAPERRALQVAVRYVQDQSGVAEDRIGVYGFSIGAFIAAQVAAVDRRVRAVVLAAPPADAVLFTRHEYAAGGPMAQWGALLGLRLGGMRFDEPQPAALVHRIAPRPLLVVTGTADRTVTPAMARELYAAAGEPKRLWLVAGAGHGGYDAVAPDFGAGIRTFFDGALAPTAGAGAGAPPTPIATR